MIWLLLIFGMFAISKLRQTPTPAIGGLKREHDELPNIGTVDYSNPSEMMDVAHEAQKAGFPETAKALASKAQETADVAKAIESMEVPTTSPIPGVTAAQWLAFTNLFRGANQREISPAYHLGLFNIGYLRLRDLALATDVKQTTFEGRTVWKGKLKEPVTEKSFLDNPALQYQVFAKDMVERAKYIRESFPHLLGKELRGLEKRPVTLSGLLAVIKLAGTKGFGQWVQSHKERIKFERTTAAFKMANGLF